MKLHRNIALGIELGLKNTLVEKKPAADVIKRLLKSNTKWGSRDRKAIGKIFYDIIRQKRLIEASLGFKNNQTNNNLLQLIGGWMALNGHIPPDWEEFVNIEIQDVVRKADRLIKERKFKYSIPDWLDEMGVEEFGESIWGKEIDELNLTDIPNRKILVLLAEHERVTDNNAVIGFIKKHNFINVEKIKKAQHEILIEKEELRREALSLMHRFLKSS